MPAGGDIADPDENPKFAHKLTFLAEMTAHFVKNQPEKAVLVGDLNIDGKIEPEYSESISLMGLTSTPLDGPLTATNGFSTAG